MKYVIFSAGSFGQLALELLGYLRVLCFVDNYSCEKELKGKKIINFDALMALNLEDIIVVVASKYHSQEIEQQVRANGIVKYFVFHDYDFRMGIEVLPTYALNKQIETVSYNRILSCNNVSAYKRISILGTNHYIPYLLSEISIQNDYNNILEIISLEDTDIAQCMGIPIVTWEKANKDFDCLIINKKRQLVKDLEKYENAEGDFDIIDIYDADLVEPSFYHPELKKYKNMCKGKRIFIIGNGPSLTFEDLDILHQHKEVCIACNRLYRAYDQTSFRADFYLISDQYVIEDFGEELGNIPGHLFIGDGYHLEKPDFVMKEIQYYHDKYPAFFPNYPKFSEDFSQGFFRGGTILYSGLQLAVYLGVKEIYLIGVDHNFSYSSIVTEENHFISNYFTKEEKEKYKSKEYQAITYEKDNVTKAYEAAELYSKKHGFKIYNATRGGKLEVFERVNFDSLFSDYI